MEPSFNSKEKSLMAYFIRNRKVGYVLTLIILIWGAFSSFLIPKESAPYIAFGVANISTVYQGVSAIDIDQLITQKIESKIKNNSGISKITSSSRNSVSNISIEYEPDVDMTRALSDLRSKVDEAKPTLPQEIDNGPTVTEIDSSRQPFTSIVLSGPYNKLELRDFGEKFKKHLEGVSNVAQVSLSGGEEREIVVELDRVKLESYGLTAQEVIGSISSTHRDIPIGDFDIEDLTYSVRFVGRHSNVDDIKNIDIALASNTDYPTILKVGDLAQVYEDGEESDAVNRFLEKDGEEMEVTNSITLTLSKSANRDILKVAGAVKQAAIDYFEREFPDDLKINFIQEVEPLTRDDFKLVLDSGATAVVIVLLLIFIFVGFKEAFLAGLVIPLTFLVTIGILRSIGYTLSFMTNFSMILALGILVDTAIVVVEGCHDYVKRGFTPYKAAIMALHEFSKPLISGTLTTLAVFIPLFTLPGVLGKYLSFIPVTVFIVLLSSLFISLLLIPLFASRVLKAETEIKRFKFFGNMARKTRKVFNGFMGAIINFYGGMTRMMLKRRYLRLGLIYVITIVFFASWKIPLKFDLFPSGDAPFVNVAVNLETGAIAEKVANYAVQVEEKIISYPEVKLMSTSVNGNSASIYVELLNEKERKAQGMRTSLELTNIWQDEFEEFTDAEVRVQNAQNGPPSDNPVAFRIVAADADLIDAAQKVAADFKDILKEIPGTTGVNDDIELIPGEIRYQVKRDVALAFGVDPNAVAVAVRTALEGSTAAVITRDGRDIDVTVRFDDREVESLNQIESLNVKSRSGALISLAELVDFEIVPALSNIKRIDTSLAFTVSSLLTEDGNAQEITTAFKNQIADYDLPNGITLIEAGENEENAELFAALGSAFAIAVLIMFMILVVQFQSYIQPLIILSTILFANIGVNAGLYITETPRSLAVILGLITLSGIVVNDAIILIDQVNKKRNEKIQTMNGGLAVTDDEAVPLPKKELIDSVIDAAKSRFNPILLTTLTTAAGIIPLVFVDTFWAGLSYTVIFGLVVASFLTLYVTPAIYYQFQREKAITFLPPVVLGMGAFAASQLFASEPLIPGVMNQLITSVAVIGTLVLAYVTFRLYLKARRKDRMGA